MPGSIPAVPDPSQPCQSHPQPCQDPSQPCQDPSQPCQIHPQPCQDPSQPCQIHPSRARIHPSRARIHPQPCQIHPQPCQIHPQPCQDPSQPCQSHPSRARIHPQPCQIHPQPCQIHPSRARSIPSRARSIPSRARIHPSRARAIPAVPDPSQPCQIHPQPCQSHPQPCQIHPSRARSIPAVPGSVPSRARSIPSRARSIPSRARSIPSRARIHPSRARSIPSRARAIPAVPDPSQPCQDPSPAVPEPSPAVPGSVPALPGAVWGWGGFGGAFPTARMRNWNHQLPERPVEPLQVLQELGLSQMFPAQMFPQQEPPSGGSQMFPAQMFPAQMFPAQMFPAQMFPQQEPPSAAPGASRGAKERRKRPRSDTDGAEILKDVSGSEILGDVSGTEILGDVSGTEILGDVSRVEILGDVSGSGTGPSGTGPSGTGPFPNPPVHVPLARLLEMEEELICADEVDTEFECGEPAVPAVPPAVPPAASQRPAQGPGDSGWHRVPAGLRAALRDGSARWHQRDFAAAAAKFSTALELCSRGFAAEDPSRSSRDEISRLSSWIQPKLVVCYLKLGQPGLALLHSHRSIAQNPSHFCNHLRQAACFRRLRRYPEAARSAMVAHFLYVLSDAARPRTSDLLQLYWQAMIQEAVREEVSFAVLYTPFEKENKAEKMKEAKKTFAEKNPGYVQHIFTDPHGTHLLPEKAESHPGQQYLLTLGFRDKELGKAVEKFVTQNLPVFPGRKIPFSPGTGGEAETFWQNAGKRIMAAVAFVGSSRIKDTRGPCARAIEQLRGATLLSHLQNGQERAQVVAQVMAQVMAQVVAELATLPHLQRGSQEDDRLLQSLMEDAADILAGGTGERVWTKIQKVALIEEYLRGGEEHQVRTSPVGMENISRAPRPQKFLRLQNTNVLIPSPRSLVTRPKKPRVVFAKS
nr:spermatogenesis-associated protein 16 [Taeniopygia guttata]